MFHNSYLRRLGFRQGPPQDDLPFAFWQKRIKEMFGEAIAARCTEDNYLEIFQVHLAYCEKLYFTLLVRGKITDRDVMDLLHDCNVGDGEWAEKLVAAILIKKTKLTPAEDQKTTKTPIATKATNICHLLKDKKKRERFQRLHNFVRRDKGILSYAKTDTSHYSPLCSDGARSLSPDRIPAMIHAERGNFEKLKKIFDDLGADKKKFCLETRDSQTRCTLLHAAAFSGSRECLDLIIEVAGDDIKKLYDTLHQRTPAFYAVTSGSLYSLKRILQLFGTHHLDIKKEFYSPDRLEHVFSCDNLLNDAIYRQDLPALRLILEWLKENGSLHLAFDLYQANHPYYRPNSLTLINHIHSGAMFYLLNEYSLISSCYLLDLMNDEKIDKSFSISCLANHKMLVFEQEKAKTVSSTILTSRQ